MAVILLQAIATRLIEHAARLNCIQSLRLYTRAWAHAETSFNGRKFYLIFCAQRKNIVKICNVCCFQKYE